MFTHRVMPSLHTQRRPCGLGAHVCNKVREWAEDRTELMCQVTQCGEIITIFFKNRRKQAITDTQQREMEIFLSTFDGISQKSFKVVARDIAKCVLIP